MLSPALMTTQQLSGTAKVVAEFERLGLANRAVIDGVAVAGPLVGLANNKTDRWERFVRQAIVFTVGFLIAPLHAKLLSRHFSKALGFEAKGLNEKLLELSYRDLEDVNKMKTGLSQLFDKVPDAVSQRTSEALRKSILAAKSKFLMSDLALLCTLFSSVGFIRVLAGKLKSGKDQFSAELGVVDQNKLDQLYQQEKTKQKVSKRMKEILTLGLGITLPTLLGAGFWKSYQKPGSKGLLKKIAPLFDYVYPRTARFLKSWPMMSVAGVVLSSLILTIGELAASRSKREFKTTAIQRNSIDALFLFGTPLFMKLFNKGAHSIQDAVNKAAQKTDSLPVLQKAANHSANMFIVSFIMNLLSVAGIVTLTNQLTKKQVKDAASNLTIPKPTLPIQVPTPFQAFTNA